MTDAEVDYIIEISSDEECPQAEVDISIEERPEFDDDYFDDIIAWAVKDEDPNGGDANDPNIVKHTKNPASAENSRQSNKPVGREKEAQLKSIIKDGEKVKSNKNVSFFIPEQRPMAQSPSPSYSRSRSSVPFRNRFEPPGGRRQQSRSTETRRESPPRRQETKKEFDTIKNQNSNQNVFGMTSSVQQQMMNDGFQGGPQPVLASAPFLNPSEQHNIGFPGMINPINPYAGYPQMNPYAGYPQMNPYAGYPQMNPYAGYPQMNPFAGYPQMNPYAGYPQSYPNQFGMPKLLSFGEIKKEAYTDDKFDQTEVYQNSEPSVNLRMRHVGIQTNKTSCDKCKNGGIELITVATQTEISTVKYEGGQTAADKTLYYRRRDSSSSYRYDKSQRRYLN